MEEQEKSYPQMRREFYEKYTNKIVPLVRRYEDDRKRKLITSIIISTLLIIAASIVMYLLFADGSISDKKEENLAQISLFIYAAAIFSWCSIKKGFENSIKEKIMPTICSCFGNMKWSHSLYHNGKKFSDSCAIPEYSSSDYDDIFRGAYKDVNIEIVEAEYEIGSGKHRHTVFDGVIVKLEMNKSFTGHTVIKSNSLLHLSPSNKLHFTELEDTEFNKKYDVFTDDEVDARYLITPSFMERLKKMKTAFSASKVSCAFYGKNLIIALSTSKDLFALCSLIKPIDDKRQYFQMYEEIVSIIKIIDHFKLNQRLGL